MTEHNKILDANKDEWLLKGLSGANVVKATMHGITITGLHRDEFNKLIQECNSMRQMLDDYRSMYGDTLETSMTNVIIKQIYLSYRIAPTVIWDYNTLISTRRMTSILKCIYQQIYGSIYWNIFQ